MKKIAICAAALFFFLAGFAFAQDKYTPQEKSYMLSLARQTLESYLKEGKASEPKPEELSASLKESRPCFVTLMKKGEGLRGCMGLFEFGSPLYENIISRAVAAAKDDPRFPPVDYSELKDIKIEISILTEPKDLEFNSPEELLNKLTPFEDGVILHTAYGSSTYLPQVWEQLPGKEEFLSSLCQKHGASPDYWRKNYKNTRVQIYKAVHFAEDAYGGNELPIATPRRE